MSGRRILFVTWDGPQVTYLEGLFVPIFAGLKRLGHEVGVLQFTWGETGAAAACAAAGLRYQRIDVERRCGGLGAFLTAFRGGRAVDRAAREWDVDLLMPRSLLPALALMRSRAARKVPVLFDADGLAADERVEFGGLSRVGATYRTLRAIEARMVRNAAHVLVRTKRAGEILAERAGVEQERFSVVTNGRVLPPLEERPENDAPRLVYVGSLGAQYRPLEMIALADRLRGLVPGLTLQLFTGDSAAAREQIVSAGLGDADWVGVETLKPEELAARLRGFDVGLALRCRSLSMQAVAPIKIGDYLMAGLPIVGTAGVGAVETLIHEGVMLPIDGQQDVDRVAHWITARVMAKREQLRKSARRLGERLFSLQRSVTLYDAAIRKVPARTG